MNTAVLLLGSNLGDKENNINKALQLINKKIGKIIQKSKILKTIPEGYKSENIYLNLGIKIETSLSPIQLLKSLKNIEQKLGRLEDSSIKKEYTDRTIDLDIVSYNNLNFESNKLNIPHVKHTKEREFSKKILNSLY